VAEPGLGGDVAADAGFLGHLAYHGLGRVFVRFDVAAGVQPPAELSVLDQQDMVVGKHDPGGGEVADHRSFPSLTAAQTALVMQRSATGSRPG
jgi:hypothetical protein